MKAAVSIFVFLIAAGMALLYLVHIKEQQNAAALALEEGPQFICGTYYLYPPLSEEAKVGEALFKANCAACHKLDAQSTGPALRSVKARYQEEKEISVDSFLSLRRASYTKVFDLKERKCLISPEVTDTDIQNILLYTQ